MHRGGPSMTWWITEKNYTRRQCNTHSNETLSISRTGMARQRTWIGAGGVAPIRCACAGFRVLRAAFRPWCRPAMIVCDRADAGAVRHYAIDASWNEWPRRAEGGRGPPLRLV